MNAKTMVAKLAQMLVVAQVAVVLVSWLIAAAVPQSSVRSLLSNEGLRWFFRTLTDNLASPWLLYLLLIAMAVGTVRKSGVTDVCRPASFRTLTFRQRFAFRVVVAEMVLIVVVLLLLTVVPQAALLSVTGVLFPSSFTDGALPLACMLTMVVSLSYGVVSGRLASGADAVMAMTSGISRWSSLFLLYLLLAELIASVRYAF